MKITFLSLLLTTMIVGLASCDRPVVADIVVTMFPQYDMAKAIVGDKLTVHSILPPGAEVHDFEASSQDMITMENARLVIYTSEIIDTWMNEDTLADADTTVMNLSEYVDNHDEESFFEGSQAAEDDHEHDDIHYWVDPLVIVHLTEAILDEIVTLDPANVDFYTSNAASYIASIETAYNGFFDYLTVNSYLDATLYYAGHNALGLFATRHQFQIQALFEDFKPDEDLSSAQLIDFTNEVRNTGSHYLFIEEMVYPKAATTIK
ncbi:MAG: metal ABC transporter substrate-binding protein, partial [Bacilli bacterium]